MSRGGNMKPPVPARPDENGNIDCLHPKAKHVSDIKDDYYKQDFTDEELNEMWKMTPQRQRQKIHNHIHAVVRFNKNNYPFCLCAITSHYFICLIPNRNQQSEEKWQMLCRFHVMSIKKMYFGKNYLGVIFFAIRLTSIWENNQKYKPRVFIEAPIEKLLPFARVSVRNFDLAFSTAYGIPGQDIPRELRLDPDTDSPELFPRFDAKLSPSEQFQFTYFALCANESQRYEHDVVRYFHHQVLTHNGIFNVGHLPFHFLPTQDVTKSELMPIFRALIYIPYMFGIVCSRITRPDILYAVSFQLMLSKSVHFLHCSDCGVNFGLHHIAQSLSNNPLCPLQYLDFSKNVFTDFPGFFDKVFQKRPKPIWYLNFSYCELKTPIIIEMFNALTKYQVCWEVKYLHIAGSEILPEGVATYVKYLKTVSENNKKSLLSLNLTDTKPAILPMLEPLRVYPMPLRELFIANNKIDLTTYKVLVKVLKLTPTLVTLDVSNTGITAEQLAKIIIIMSNRPNLLQLTLYANRLNLNGKNLISVVKGFLNGDVTRWRKLTMDSNNMKVPDIQILTALFNRMPNLRELSLNDNFDSSMTGIEAELPDILRIRNLETLHIAGGRGKSLGKKLYPFLFTVALSYVLRMFIGGYSAREEIPVLSAVKDDTADVLDLFLHSDLVPPDAENDLDELRERFGDLLIPYLIRQSVIQKTKQLQEKPEEKEKIIEELWPMISVIAEKLSLKHESQQISHFIGHKVVDLLMEANQNFKASTLKQDLCKRVESLLRECAGACSLKYLDIRHNKIGDWGVNIVIELLKIDKELTAVDIDGSAVTTISLMTQFVSQCKECENLIKQQFPVNDARRIVKTAKQPVRKIVEVELAKEQMRLIRAIDYHRAKAGEYADLPFDLVPELRQLIIELTGKFGVYLRPETIRNHSGIVEHFGLNLPYIEDDNIGNKLPDDYKKVEIGEQIVFLAPSMKKRFMESDEILDFDYKRNYNLHRREIDDGNTDATESLAPPTDAEEFFEPPFDIEQDEEKPDFVSPMDIRKMMENTRDIINIEQEIDAPDEPIPVTGQLDIDDDTIFQMKPTTTFTPESISEIDLDSDNDELPNFYEGDVGETEEKPKKKKPKSKKAKKENLDQKSRFTLRASDLKGDVTKQKSVLIKPTFD